MKKLFVCIPLCLCLLFASACGGEPSLEKRIKELEEALSRQEQLTEELKEQLEELSSAKVDELREKLLEEAVRRETLEEAVENLRGEPIVFAEAAPDFGSVGDRRAILEVGKTHIREDSEFCDIESGKYDAFADFVSGCRALAPELAGRLFLLDPADGDTDLLPPIFTKEYALYAGEMAEDVMIVEEISVYFEALGDRSLWAAEGSEMEGGYERSFQFRLFFPVLPFALEFEFRPELRFGGCEGADGYFNICQTVHTGGKTEELRLGTCFFWADTYLSQTWLEKYFRKNLIRI